MTKQTKPQHTPGPFGESLSTAWRKYHELFGEVPHGTAQQMAAMVELMPDKRFAAAPVLYEFVKRIADDACYELPGEFPEEGESGHAPCLSCQARAAIAKAQRRLT